MRPNELVLRCFAERDGDVWVAYCLDLSLAAQADSWEEARAKLEAQVREYVADAMGGQDGKYGAALMARRAPASTYLRYYTAKVLIALAEKFHSTRRPQGRPFQEVLPLAPQTC